MAEVNPAWCLSDSLWDQVKKILPVPRQKPAGGRPRMDDRLALNAIFYVLRTGCQWKALPRSLGAPSTVYDRFRQWERLGVFKRLWQNGLRQYDQVCGIEWEWQSVDGCMTKAPLGGEKNRPQPYRPSKIGYQKEPSGRRPGDPLVTGCRWREPTR